MQNIAAPRGQSTLIEQHFNIELRARRRTDYGSAERPNPGMIIRINDIAHRVDPRIGGIKTSSRSVEITLEPRITSTGWASYDRASLLHTTEHLWSMSPFPPKTTSWALVVISTRWASHGTCSFINQSGDPQAALMRKACKQCAVRISMTRKTSPRDILTG